MPGVDYRCISFVQDGPKATLTFARPDVLNALNRQLIDELLDAFDRLSADTRVLVLRGAGAKAFAAGADMPGMRRAVDFGRAVNSRAVEEVRRFAVAASTASRRWGLRLALAYSLQRRTAKVGLPSTARHHSQRRDGRLARLVGRAPAVDSPRRQV